MLRIMLIGGEIMLFANAEVAAGATFFACLFAAINGLFGWLDRRDQRRYDLEKAEMKADIQECREDRDVLKAQNADQQRQLNDNRQQILALNAKLAQLEQKVSP